MKWGRKHFFGRRVFRPYSLDILVLCVLLIAAVCLAEQNQTASTSQANSTPVQQKNSKKLSRIYAQSAQNKLPEFSHKKNLDNTAKSASDISSQEYRLVYAADGDSFELKNHSGQRLTVRLYGIDAPEGQQSFGRESRRHLLSLIQGKSLRLHILSTDKYNRAIALVYISRNGVLDDISVNQRQIQAGMAWVYDYFCTSSFCSTWKTEEALARCQRLGLWYDKNPIPPWKWRRSSKHR